MINIADALNFAAEHYPEAPEKLIERLKIDVLYDNSMASDGWVFQYTDESKGINKTLITVNSSLSPVRQRFTLAHELAHVLLGIIPVVGETISLNQSRMTKEEREVDYLAANLLLPKSVTLQNFVRIPITASAIKRFANRSNVSEIVVALRIESLSKELGLKHAAVIFYQDDSFKWYRSNTMPFEGAGEAQEYLQKCTSAKPNMLREPFKDGTIVASLFENPTFKTKTIFLQVVDKAKGLQKSLEEQIKELQSLLFKDNFELQQRMNARIGAFKNESLAVSLDDAVELFYERLFRYPNDLIEDNFELITSASVRHYVRLKFDNWRNE